MRAWIAGVRHAWETYVPRGLQRDLQSGPAVARLFHRLLALVFLDAWVSAARQIDVLIGSRGLLPIADVVEGLHGQQVPWWRFPTPFRLGASDATLHAWIATGIVLSLLALAGIAPRLLAGVNTAMYLSVVLAGRTFFSFQWDALLLECGTLALFLPRDRRARWIHVLFRLLFLKLYFESGLAKWGSPIHDWQDGSAMTFYFETAPLPTRLAWYAHHLPVAWHHFESRATLFLELVLPFGIFGPRIVRLATAGVFTGFQIVNASTANYGFFCYLATALHVFALDDRDVKRARVALLRRLPPRLRRARFVRFDLGRKLHALVLGEGTPLWLRVDRAATAVLVVVAYCTLSLYDGALEFARSERVQQRLARWEDVYRHVAPFRVVNSYHLFAAITRTRYEAEFQTFDGTRWTGHPLRYKPGDESTPPPFVAPHQPRVDFQLWFFGLAYNRENPAFTPVPACVRTLLFRMCEDPAAVASLFRDPLPEHPFAVRIAFWDTHFTSAEERARTGAYWRRVWMQPLPGWRCP